MDKNPFATKLGLPLVSFIVIGMMVGGGVFVYTGLVYEMTGRALPLAYVLAGIPVFLSMLPLAMLGSALPVSGANYYYPSRMVSPMLAFSAVWVYALASFLGQIPLYVLAAGEYLQTVFPASDPVITAVGLLTIFYVLNLLGIKIAAQIQGVLLIILLIALAMYAGSGLKDFQSAYFSVEFGKGMGNVVLGTALLSFTYFGANGIIELGSEIKNPGKTIPRAFYIAFPLVIILYGAVALALTGTLSPNRIIKADNPLLESAEDVLRSGAFHFFVIGGAILALLTTLNALFLIGTRSLVVIVRDNIFPSWLGTLSKKKKVPWVLLTLIWILSVLGTVSGFSLDDFASFASLGGLIIFFPVLIAAIRFPKKYPDLYQRSPFKLKPWILKLTVYTGFAMVSFFGLIILVDLHSPLKTSLFVLFIGTGMVFFYLRKRYLRRKGLIFNIKPINDEEF